MKLLQVILSMSLPMAVLATPLMEREAPIEAIPINTKSIAATRDEEAKSAGLVGTNNEYCNIINVGTTVDCVRYFNLCSQTFAKFIHFMPSQVTD